MDVFGPFRRLNAAIARWIGLADSRTVFPILVVALVGPLGEMVDVALFSELEVELLASDLGLEIVTSIFVYGYHLVLLLLGCAAVAAAPLLFRADGPAAVPALVSRGPSGIPKIPKR